MCHSVHIGSSFLLWYNILVFFRTVVSFRCICYDTFDDVGFGYALVTCHISFFIISFTVLSYLSAEQKHDRVHLCKDKSDSRLLKGD